MSRHLRYCMATLSLLSFSIFAECNREVKPENIPCEKAALKKESSNLSAVVQGLSAEGLLPEDAARLKSVQAAWARYRDLSCDFQSRRGLDSASVTLFRFQCLNDMTRARIKEIEEYGHLFGS